MALIAVCVYHTHENKKDEIFEECIDSLLNTVLFHRHRLFICVNGATEKTRSILSKISEATIIYNKENIGTAAAINKAWLLRKPGEHCVKCDDDVLFDTDGWADDMERAIFYDPNAGQIAAKRKDCWEWPGHTDPDYKSELFMFPHKPGESWLLGEKVKHCIGTCVMHSSALLDKVGFLYQPSEYSYDDVIMSHRSHIAGFYNCFLPHIKIDHIDSGLTPYQDWKHKHASEQTDKVIKLVHEMRSGQRSIYYNPFA